MKFYGDTGDANSSGGSQTLQIGSSDPFAGFEDQHQSYTAASKGNSDVGKGSFDFGNVLGSIGDTGRNLAGVIGSIGIPGGPNIGGVVGAAGGAVGGALGAVGGIELPRVAIPGIGNADPNAHATLGDVPGAIGGAIGGVLGAPEKFVETQAAKGRLTGNSGGTDLLNNIGRFLFGSTTDKMQSIYDKLVAEGKPIPPDLLKAIQEQQAKNDPGVPEEFQQRLAAGENVDALAAEMASKGIGFNNDPGANLAASVFLDPTNLLSFGAGKVATLAKNADIAIKRGEEIGVGARFMGKAYDAASRGLSAGAAAMTDRMLGPATSGVFHALGSRPYFAIRDSVGRLAPAYKTAFEDAYAYGAAQMPRAVIAKQMAQDATQLIKNYGSQAAERVMKPDVGGSIEAQLSAIRKYSPAQIERRTEELLTRVTPDFAGHTDEGRFIETRDKLAQITGMSAEDAAKALGGKADLRTAQHVHLAFYGKAGDDLTRAKVLAAGAKGIDPARVTLIGEDTLTAERAADILAGKADLVSAVDQYSILRNRFGGTAFDHEKVKAFVKKLASEDALPKAVASAVTGKNPLPPALKDWERAYEPFGYLVGLAPKDGWKTVVDDAGEVLYADPFAHFVSAAEPLTTRNPIGRFTDSLFRGTTQSRIIADSRARMVQVTKGAGISANEARAVHQRILQTAADFSLSPRGLSLHGPTVFRDIFRDVLGEERFAQMIQHVDPDFAVMKAFEGDWQRVGLTQKFTGKVKTAASGRGNVTAAIAEGIYPALRFRFSALFQSQEIIESPFLNLLRGIRNRIVAPDVQKVYADLADLPDFRYLSEAGYTLNIAGANQVGKTMTAQNTLLGKALARFPNVAKFKEKQRVAQVMWEHGPAFEEAVNTINPKLWRRMVEAYGTTDSRVIADRFISERAALASGNLDEAMATFDAAKPQFIESLYAAGKTAEGQAANVAAGVARGANGAGGAMKLTAEELARIGATPLVNTHDMETVWQAFRESLRQTSQQAFKTHYFSPERGFLERTINHPYLGLYPASYMWGKVLPEFARFMLKRPFGLNAPLLGIHAYNRVQQSVVAALANDPEFNKWVQDSNNDGALYLLDQLLPALPSNLPANLPAWARHLVRDKPKDPQAFIQKEAGDMFTNAAGPIKTINTFGNAAADIFDQSGSIFDRLTRSAAQLDAQYPRANAAPGFADFSGAPLTDGSGQHRGGLPPGSENQFVPTAQLDASQVIDARGRKTLPRPRAS